MSTAQNYLDTLSGLIKSLESEQGLIETAAGILADAVKADRLIHVFGVDPYSASSSDEFFFKAGGLVNISPIYDPTFSYSHGASRCGMCQKLDGLSPAILDYYEYIEPGDPIIIISSDPNNLVFQQALEKSRVMGLKTIAIVPSAPGQVIKNADVTISTHAPAVDTVTDVSGLKSGGVASALTSAVINTLVLVTLEKLDSPVVWIGDRIADCDKNEQLIDKYIERVKHL